MPRFDLCKNKTEFDPLAPFKVLAIMCQPNDRVRREQMLGLLHSETGHGRPRRKPISSEEFLREVKLTSPRGDVAGHLLLTRLQLREQGLRYSLNQALPLVAASLPRWKQPKGYDWSRDAYVGHHPHNFWKMRQIYEQFGSVAHLWAALIHGGQQGRDDISSGSCATLPVFLAYADCFLAKTRKFPIPARDRRTARTVSDAWVFTIPARLRQSVSLNALPLHKVQLCVLNEQKARN